MFANEAKHSDADIVAQVLCTSPFLDAKTIDKALSDFKQSNHTSLVAVSKNKIYKWENDSPTYGSRIPNSKDLPDTIAESMSFYAVKTKGLPVNKRYTEDVMFIELSPMQNIDINNSDDLELAKIVCAGQRSIRTQKLKILSKVISSSMLSDICKEMKLRHFLSDNIKPLSKGNFLGYAKTLQLQPLEDKNWKSIFKALESYDFIEPGDVIVVATDVPDKAYFGDLNATFAMRQGAVGVVIDGHTRDVERVSQMGLPVYAHGSKPDDIRFEGTVTGMNTTVTINEIKIKNNDIIFADGDGVICIPQERWQEILGKLRNKLQTEMMVKLEATFGADPLDVLDNIGEF
jgi:regulator of RNase E activity RraA